MNIGIGIILLIYLMIVAVGFIAYIYLSKKSRTGYLVINKSYTNALFVLFITIVLAITMIALPFIPVDKSSAGQLILGSKIISLLTLCVSLFVLSKRYFKQPPYSK
ncbi:hypothetical protein AM500_14530 [Bacillus sp. FJAT-18017]|uniref:hypothetical protein n=1 Tax=Bacillus sp. FJAT-18017 TaxID=1705566 RepID=UPI0006AE1EC0|nr:hypothetical protein [Bacillus sp. FJAT-18017]ALC90865.1 hypothetical protein AM500_14530 [Bacillus sp. FJAT-18017]